MKTLYARFALWLIRPALELHKSRGALGRTFSVEEINRGRLFWGANPNDPSELVAAATAARQQGNGEPPLGTSSTESLRS